MRKKRLWKQVLAAILSAVLALSMPTAAFAEEVQEENSGEETETPTEEEEGDGSEDFNIEDGVLTKYWGEDGEVTIPGDVDSIGNYAFENCTSLTSVTIPSNVTYIGYGAFKGCSALKSIAISEGVETIDENAFEGCESLETITIPNSVTELGGSAFYGCKKLKQAVLPTGIKELNWSLFYGCSSLTEIKIPSGVETIWSDVFNECTFLETIEIPSSVTSIWSGAFTDTPWLVNQRETREDSLVIVNNLLIDGQAASGSVSIPNGVTTISNTAFAECKDITAITVPGSVTTIKECAFLDCSNLTTVTFSDPSSLTTIEVWAFKGTAWLANQQKNNRFVIVNGILIDGTACTGEITIPDTVKTIGVEAFCDCGGVTKVTIQSGVTKIESYSFSYCGGLKKIVIPSSVTEIGEGVFNGCNGLTIYGTAGSAAQKYVQEYGQEQGITFSTGDPSITDITDCGITLGFYSATYDGSYQQPSVTVTYDGKTLTRNRDYTLSYSNNLNAGTAQAVVTGIGNYKGTDSRSFTISARPLSTCQISAINPQVYTGKEIRPALTAAYGGRTLTANVDYTVSYSSNINVGTAQAVLYGRGNYTGTISLSFRIVKTIPVSDCVISLGFSDIAYNGAEQRPSVTAFYDGKKMTESIDYTVSYANNVNAGTAHVILNGMGDYSGTSSLPFTITEKSISGCQISAISPQTYTGADIVPTVTVKDGSTVLRRGTDYTLTYSGNRDAGTAFVYIIGNGNYTGSLTQTFTIGKAAQTIKYTTAYKKVYSSKAFTVNAKRISGEGSLSYASSNKNVVTVNQSGRVTIKGTGAATITVKAAEMSNYKEKSVKITITVSPDRQTVKSLATAKGRKLTVKWKKDTRATGYQIQYSTSKNFSGAKTVNIGKNTTTSKTLTKLTKGKRYYLRVRSYKTATVNGTTKKLYGAWSGAKRSGSIKK